MKFLLALLVALAMTATSPTAEAQTDDIARAKALYKQVTELIDAGRYADAVPVSTEALEIVEKAFGLDDSNVAASLNNLAWLYREQGLYAEAEPMYLRALAIYEATLGPDHPDIAITLSNLAQLYGSQGRYAEVEPLFERALEIKESALGADHRSVAITLNNLAVFYLRQARYAEAEPLFLRALEIETGALGSDHPAVAQTLGNLAALYRDQGEYADAEPLLERALEILQDTLGDEHPDVAASLDNLARLYQVQSRHAAAEPLFQRALAIREKTLGFDHPVSAESLNNLAMLYSDQSRHAEAEPVLKRALAIYEKTLGPEHASTATAIDNLAVIYKDQNRLIDAEPLHKRALEIREKALGPDHPEVATSLNNLALLRHSQGQYNDAEALFKRAMGIQVAKFGTDHPRVALTLHNLAFVYESQARPTAALRAYERALEIREKAFGRDHPSVAATVTNLALLYKGTYLTKAEPSFKRALGIYEAAYGPNHPDVANSLFHLASLYQAQGNFTAALPTSARAVEILERRLSEGAGQRSSNDVAVRRQARGQLVGNIKLMDRAIAKDHSLQGAPESTFRVAQLAQASAAGEAVAGMAARFAAGSDALAATVRERQDLTDRWRSLDAAMVKAASRPPVERNAAEEAKLRETLVEASKRLDGLDARIAKDFPQYAELSAPKPLSAVAIRGLLAPDEALLVYIVSEEQSWLWALRGDKIEWHRIDVGAYELKGEVQALRHALDPAFNARLKPFPATRAYELHQKILAPATALLAGARHVFIVPDAALESLPIGVLVTKPPKEDPDDPEDHREVAWFAREHAITVLPSVGSLRALRLFSSAARASKPFLGIGNPILEGQPGTVRGAQLASLFRGAVADVDAVRRLDPLPDTADELRAVAKSKGAGDADLLLADRATEPQIRATALDAYQVVHFATHGLVVGEMKGLAEPALVLTPPAQATPDDDGLLTASKVATLKLNADWVVLSACNTAAGDGAPGAGGLSGLAKAFFYAGARSLLVSHWSVPSEATVKLVTGAFDALGKEPGIGRAEALRRSQMAMLDPSSKAEFAHPLFWAPFVLAGEGGAGR